MRLTTGRFVSPCAIRHRRSFAGSVALGLLAACSGGGHDVVLDTAAATSAAVATTAETTSATLATTVPLTTSTSTPVVPTAPSIDPEQLVREAVGASIEAFSTCLLALPSCDVQTLESTRRGELLDVNVQRISEWNAAGYAVRDRDSFRYVIEQVELNADATQATVVVCIADGTKLVIPGAGPGSADVIVDDSYISGREAWDVRLDPDGVWRAYAAPPAGPTESRDVCPAA